MFELADPEITQLKRIYRADSRFGTHQALLLTMLALLGAILLVIEEDSLAVFTGSLLALAAPLHLQSREHSVELMHLLTICWLLIDGRWEGLLLALGLAASMLCRLQFEEGPAEWVELPMRVANVNLPCFV